MRKRVKRKPQWLKGRKSCVFCRDKVKEISFFNYERLKKEISERGKILPRRVTKNCAKHQRIITTSIKQARQLALLSYTRR